MVRTRASNKDNNITIMWDMPVNTDITITANRPDIIVKDSVNSTCKLIDITVSSDRNIALKETEKNSKYKDLEVEIQRMWHMKTVVIPVVVGVLGTVKKGMLESIKKVSERATMTEIQKSCMLGSARILRKVLWVYEQNDWLMIKEIIIKKFRGSTSTKWFFIYPIPDRIGIWKCWFLRKGENWSTRRKTSRSKGENHATTNSTHVWRRHRDLNPGHIGGRRALSPLRHPLLFLIWPMQGCATGQGIVLLTRCL